MRLAFQAEVVKAADSAPLERLYGRFRHQIGKSVLRFCIEPPVEGRQEGVHDIGSTVSFEAFIYQRGRFASWTHHILFADCSNMRLEVSLIVIADLSGLEKEFVSVADTAHRKISSSRYVSRRALRHPACTNVSRISRSVCRHSPFSRRSARCSAR